MGISFAPAAIYPQKCVLSFLSWTGCCLPLNLTLIATVVGMFIIVLNSSQVDQKTSKAIIPAMLIIFVYLVVVCSIDRREIPNVLHRRNFGTGIFKLVIGTNLTQTILADP